MNLKDAIDKAINKEKSSSVTSGHYKPSKKVKIQVKPIKDLKNSENHFIVDKHIANLESITNKKIESVDDLPDNCFIIQIVEKGQNKMGELFDQSDVFDESIFNDYVEATQWIDRKGYIK